MAKNIYICSLDFHCSIYERFIMAQLQSLLPKFLVEIFVQGWQINLFGALFKGCLICAKLNNKTFFSKSLFLKSTFNNHGKVPVGLACIDRQLRCPHRIRQCRPRWCSPRHRRSSDWTHLTMNTHHL